MENNEFEPADAGKKPASQTDSAGWKVDLLAYLQDVVHVLAGIVLVFLLFFRIVVVNGPSMEQTLVHNDYVILINNIFYQNQQQGDIVVISKDTFRDGEPIIKRIIATENQVVDIDFEEGVVYVDGISLDEPYTNTPTNLPEGMTFPLTVSKNCVFVMGDNRNESQDSRSTEIGLIDTRQILGKAIFLAIPGPNPDTREREFTRIGVLS